MSAEVVARRRWARRMVSRCPTAPPKYGSPEWHRLSEDDVRRIAAVVIAAEAWQVDGDELLERLRSEVEFLRIGHKREEDAEYCARRDAHLRRRHPANLAAARVRLAAEIETEWQAWIGASE